MALVAGTLYTERGARVKRRGGGGMRRLRGSRPFPLDPARRDRCMAALRERNMTVTELAEDAGIARESVSRVLHGRILSDSYEERIAAVLGESRERLFPRRTAAEIMRLREQEAKRRERRAAYLAWRERRDGGA